MQQQVPPTIIPQPGIAIPTTLATSQQVTPVSYPNPRVLQQQNTSPKQRVFTGTVTKLHDNFGFVDEDVFLRESGTLLIFKVKGQGHWVKFLPHNILVNTLESTSFNGF